MQQPFASRGKDTSVCHFKWPIGLTFSTESASFLHNSEDFSNAFIPSWWTLDGVPPKLCRIRILYYSKYDLHADVNRPLVWTFLLQFRTAWLLLPFQQPLYSRASVSISTLPHGPPEDAPIIESLSPLGADRLSVSWSEPRFSNGPPVSFELVLDQVNGSHSVLKVRSWSLRVQVNAKAAEFET